VALKVLLVDGHVLHRHDSLSGQMFDHFVQQKGRVSVIKPIEDKRDIESHYTINKKN
jgi:hypothetical protein